jgi:outer membrane protein OmpA-like peptidoglycan-associated protein
MLLLLTTLLISGKGVAQANLSSTSKKAIAYYTEADNYRVRRQYDQAIALLENAIKKDDHFIEAYARLAEIYHVLDALELAEGNYQTAIDLAAGSRKYSDVYLNIAKVQITLERYEAAKGNIERYLDFALKNKRKSAAAKLLLSKAIYALEHINSPLAFSPTSLNESVNQFAMQYFPVVTADENTLLYTKRDGNSPYDDEDIMISTKNEQGDWGEPTSISAKINSELNEGTCAISADGRTLVFTSCQGREGFGSCDLYISYKHGDDWSKPENLGSSINSIAWESQPSLSADGRTLYFVSNRKGGLGGRDIWVSANKEGEWGVPLNLGDKVNTSNEEVSPFIHPNGKTLYFASDGLPGFGGFDIYSNELDTNHVWSTLKNMGYPINRGTDQMSLVITSDGSKGFYSDSGGNRKLSEIKEFDVPEEIQLKYKTHYVSGIVTDEQTKLALGARVQLYDINSRELLSEVVSDAISGDYLMVLTEGGNYALYIEKTGYVFQSINFNFEKALSHKSVDIDITLTPIAKGVTSILNNVFFAHDSYELNEESRVELDKVAKFIRTNDLKLEIGGYADQTGGQAYNQVLSEKRAKSVYDYLIEINRIPQNALSYKGYGQDISNVSGQLAHARRIEFKLL